MRCCSGNSEPMKAGAKRKWQEADVRTSWQAQVPRLYDLVVSHVRSPGVRSLQWPGGAARIEQGVVLQRMVVGTAEAILIMAVRLPWHEPMTRESDFCQPWQGTPAGHSQPFVRVTQYMAHEGPVEHLSCSPHTYLLLASQAEGSGEVLLFRAADWQVAANNTCRPERRLAIEAAGGCGTSWMGAGGCQLLAGSAAGAHLWDVEVGSLVKTFPGQSSVTTAVAASTASPQLFATSGSDGCCTLWDARVGSTIFQRHCHLGPAHCAEFAPGGIERLASGGADRILLWEIRHPGQPCNLSWDGADFQGVSHMTWSPFSNNMLAAAYGDGRVLLWDVEKAHNQRADGMEAPGVTFVHGGHAQRQPSGVAWSSDCPWLLASADAEEMQFWRPSREVLESQVERD
ncbi:unnamed protein product [Effrenium voratum]|nr:unnamed protein product [Effrenium voratum]